MDKEGREKKEVKILKCEKCGKEYLFDSVSQYYSECGGILKTETVSK
jgi:hypothetical protein